MEADRKALSGDARVHIESQIGDKYTYRAGPKVNPCWTGFFLFVVQHLLIK